MERAPRSCLLCSTKVEPTSLSSPLLGKFPGGAECPLLEKELERVFIPRYLLDIPSTFCEGIIGQDGLLFQICGQCYYSKVITAWEIHQQCLALEKKMRRLKKEVKEEMKNGLRKDRMSGKVDEQIREFLFPERLVPDADVKVEVTSDFEDNVSNYSFDKDPPSPEVNNRKRGGLPKNRLEKVVKTEVNKITPKSGNPRPKKKRIRPYKPRLKPRAYSEVYRNRHGILRRSTFRWITCPMCKTKFRQPEELEAHKLAHQLSLESGGQFACAICSYPGNDLADLERHQRNRHKVEVKSFKKMQHCTQCTTFKTDSWNILKRHYEQNHPTFIDEAQPTCEVCLKTFQYSQGLAKHLAREHPGPKPPKAVTEVETVIISCEQCSMKFPNRESLRRHLRLVHERPKNHICSECGKGFQSPYELDRHSVTHDKEARRDFICHLCGCDYPIESSLITHHKKVHEKELQGGDEAPTQKQFKCKLCELESPYKVVIMRHMNEHKKELGHDCHICGKRYLIAASLRTHMRLKHTEGKVECPYCEREFPNMMYMKAHQRKYCQIKNLEECSGGGASSDTTS